jgi:hypothetical protein
LGFRVVVDDPSDEAETVALTNRLRTIGAGEVEIRYAHILEFELGPNRGFGTLVPRSDEEVVLSAWVVAVGGHVLDRTIELDGSPAVLVHEACDRLIAVVRDLQKRREILTVVGSQDLLGVRLT